MKQEKGILICEFDSSIDFEKYIIAEEKITRINITKKDDEEDVKEKIVNYTISIKDIEDHIWKHHGSDSSSRDNMENEYQSWFTINKDEVSYYLNKIKDTELLDDLSDWVVDIITNGIFPFKDRSNKNYDKYESISSCNKVVGMIRNNDTDKIIDCKKIYLSFHMENNGGKYGLYLATAFPV